MINQNERDKKIKVLQENLSSIRKIAGWTTEQLGDKIGVTKQTISNLENNKSPMNFTQYIAIRSILDCEIEENTENEVLASVVDILLDKSEELRDEDYQEIRKNVDVVAKTAAGGVDKEVLKSTYNILIGTILMGLGVGLLGPIGGAIAGGIAGVKGSKWLIKILNK